MRGVAWIFSYVLGAVLAAGVLRAQPIPEETNFDDSRNLSSEALETSAPIVSADVDAIISRLSPAEALQFLTASGFFDKEVPPLNEEFDIPRTVHAWDEPLNLREDSLSQVNMPTPEAMAELVNRYSTIVDQSFKRSLRKAFEKSVRRAVEHHLRDFPDDQKKIFKDRFIQALGVQLSWQTDLSRNSESFDRGRLDEYIYVASQIFVKEFGLKGWRRFARAVETVFTKGYERWATNDFLAAIGRRELEFRESDFARIRFVLKDASSRNNPHVVAKIIPSGRRVTVVELNPPLSVNRGIISDGDGQVQQYRRRLLLSTKRSVLLTTMNGKTETPQPLSYYLPPTRYSLEHQLLRIRQSYEAPSWSTFGAGMVSGTINLGILTAGFFIKDYIDHHTISSLPALIAANATALKVKGAYFIFCSTFSHMYDRWMRSENPLWETSKKSTFVLPFNYAVLGLTNGWSSLWAILPAIPMSFFEKVGSTNMARPVRARQEMGLLRGHWEIRARDLNPASLFRRAESQENNDVPLTQEQLKALIKEERKQEAHRLIQNSERSGWRNILGDIVLFRIDRVMAIRELQGMMRMVPKTMSYAVDKALGVPIGSIGVVALSFRSHYKGWKQAVQKRAEYTDRQLPLVAERYDRLAKKYENDAWVIPGLFPRAQRLWNSETANRIRATCRRPLEELGLLFRPTRRN